MARKRKRITVSYMVKAWVEEQITADTLEQALELTSKPRLEDVIEFPEGIECLDATVVRVGAQDIDRITVND